MIPVMPDQIIFTSSTIDKKVLLSCNSLIAAFFPGRKIIPGSPADPAACPPDAGTTLSLDGNRDLVFTAGFFTDKQEVSRRIDFSGDEELTSLPLPGKEPLFQIMVKRALFVFLTAITGQRIPWGILTGMRPGKLMARMDELQLQDREQKKILRDLYLVEEEKIFLLDTIREIQSPYLQTMRARPDLIALYLTIPFCPSRCFYCSFPSHSLTAKNSGLLESYLEALAQEIRLTGKMMNELGLKADSIYIGGGTPTVLAAEKLAVLLQNIRRDIPAAADLEYTVEGGRPDTLDKAKFTLLQAFGVSRISINPQSMQDQTLRQIGRNHQVADIVACFRLAREIGSFFINMDLILGLPGEGAAAVQDSLQQVLHLHPDNLTLHALALKRGSDAWENHYVPARQEHWAEILRETGLAIRQEGYLPYYFYRQKNIAGNLENTGYCRPGTACRYNMAIIEEKQTIIGLGAGAASKILKKDAGHTNLYNPLDLPLYITRLAENHRKRAELFAAKL